MLRAYPDRVGSRSDRDGRGVVPGGEQPGRLVAIVDSQPMARLIDVGVDGVFGDSQPPGDLLGAEVLMDQPQALALARSQLLDRLSVGLCTPTHGATLNEESPTVQRVEPS